MLLEALWPLAADRPTDMEYLTELVKRVSAVEDMELDELIEQLVKFAETVVKYVIDRLPQAEKFLINTLDAMFAPKQILRQVVMITVLQLSVMVYQSTSKAFDKFKLYFYRKGREEKKLMDELSSAKTYAQWKLAADALDALRGLDKWRSDDRSGLYDSKMLIKRITGTTDMLARRDIFNLMFRLRGSLAREQFGMQHEGLFSRALGGTKHLVEKYHDTMAFALDYICDVDDDEIPTDAKLAFFNETRHSYGRTALLLSGGAYLGYYHIGVLKALLIEGLLPRVISGASAGALMTALMGTRTEAELAEFINDPVGAASKIRMDFFLFSDVLNSEVAKKLQYLVPQSLRWLSQPLLSSIFDKKILNLDTDHFKSVVLENIGTCTFQEAFDRTGRIINITVAPMNNYDPPRLLNYLTAPHVCVWSAAAASCALPGIFDSISLIVKEPNGKFRPENEWTRQHLTEDAVETNKTAISYSDGSLENDLPMQQLSELFNVNHFIVSQVNPHSAILSTMAIRANVWSHPLYGAIAGYVRFLKAQCRDWLKNIINLLVYRAKAPVWNAKRGLSQTLTQEYEGRENDITIMPWLGHTSYTSAFLNAIKNPTIDEYIEMTTAGERNTWPSIPRIRAHCSVEMTLDQCVQRLRKRISQEGMDRTSFLPAVKKIDRTPSFYTSRSILNLSGLSVSDPMPAYRNDDSESVNIPYNGIGSDDENDHSKFEKSLSPQDGTLAAGMSKFYNMGSSKDNSSRRKRIGSDPGPKLVEASAQAMALSNGQARSPREGGRAVRRSSGKGNNMR